MLNNITDQRLINRLVELRDRMDLLNDFLVHTDDPEKCEVLYVEINRVLAEVSRIELLWEAHSHLN